MNYRNIIIVIISIIVLVVGTLFLYKQNISKVPAPVLEKTDVIIKEPQRTDFGTNVPTDFPTNIPIENGAKFEQSYSLNYVGQKQMTIVFDSAKTVKENYTLYTDFLEKQNWSIVNKYESDNVSSLYGTKWNNDMSITITRDQVSISVLKK